MTVNELLKQLETTPESIEFANVIATIDRHYSFNESSFTNGDTSNAAGENNGSCKILAFATLNNLSQKSTLHCFGEFYLSDVLKKPAGNDHQNIRQFMIHGWDGVKFSADPLSPLGE